MSLYRKNPKRDANEAAIVQALERCGASVVRLSEKGCPDLMVGRPVPLCGSPGCRICGTRNGIVLLEVKRTKGTLTPDQVRWREAWKGPQPITVRSVEDALTAIGVKL